MDIFVRGLTVLLFSFRRPERKEGSVTVSDLLGVFSVESNVNDPVATDAAKFMIQRFLECDLLPAVDTVNAPLDYDDRKLSDEAFCEIYWRQSRTSMTMFFSTTGPEWIA
jgi:hypothetical protein